ncbi:MAG: ABC transporter permease, partial [bacterium]|nr:ABC transporter permease [bacterium]
MRNFAAIYGREMRAYFNSPIAYVVAAGFLALMGYFFQNYLLTFNEYCRAYSIQHQEAGMPSPNVNAWVVSNFFGVQFFMWLIVTPMLTMRLYAEEKRSGTLELLMTSPITNWQTLLGKFFSCLSLYMAIEVLAFFLVFVLSFYARINWGPVISAGLVVLLMGGTFISVGILASAMTDNQIVSAVISFVLLMMLWMIDWSAQFVDRTLSELLRYL